MHLFDADISKRFDFFLCSGASHNGIVYQDDFFFVNEILDRIELQINNGFSTVLRRLDERPSDVMISGDRHLER